MKKIVLIGIIILSLAGSCFAQSAANRTWKTKVSDALGLMPAPNEAEYTRLMGDLVSTGAEGVDMLVSMFDGTNNVPVSYALGRMVGFRQPTRTGRMHVKSSRKVLCADSKKAAIAKSRLFMSDCCNSVAKRRALMHSLPLIDTPDLFAPALTSLVSNGTEQSKTAIAKAITQRNGVRTLLRWISMPH